MLNRSKYCFAPCTIPGAVVKAAVALTPICEQMACKQHRHHWKCPWPACNVVAQGMIVSPTGSRRILRHSSSTLGHIDGTGKHPSIWCALRMSHPAFARLLI